MHLIRLRNDIEMPAIMMGTSICDLRGDKKKLISQLENAMDFALKSQEVGFDTARDYNNEQLLGDIFYKMKLNGVSRDSIFVTTKVGNGQQRLKDMREQIDQSLKSMRLDYIDLWLLHWPLPDFWLDNWSQLLDIYKSGKVRAIGIANCRERHIEMLKTNGLDMPHVMQVEYHPFRTINNFRSLCKQNNIQIEAYSANCLMLPFVNENLILNNIANLYHKSVTQIIMRWHVQQGVVPIFRSFNPSHISDNINIMDFKLSSDEMNQIFSLDNDYKFHPESLNCPGY